MKQCIFPLLAAVSIFVAAKNTYLSGRVAKALCTNLKETNLQLPFRVRDLNEKPPDTRKYLWNHDGPLGSRFQQVDQQEVDDECNNNNQDKSASKKLRARSAQQREEMECDGRGYNCSFRGEQLKHLEGDLLSNKVPLDNFLNSTHTWGKIVPFIWSEDEFDISDATTIAKGMVVIRRISCIEFKREINKTSTNYVKITSKDKGCFSHAGKIGGEQILNLGPECWTVGVSVHQLMHVLGFQHEHLRPDRDQFIKIVPDKVNPDFKDHFNKRANNSWDAGFKYDYDSIMHCSPTYFSKRGCDTVEIANRSDGTTPEVEIGQRGRLSKTDIIKLRKLGGVENLGMKEICPDIANRTVDSLVADLVFAVEEITYPPHDVQNSA